MLDAFIIEKIKREQERNDSERVPLRIEQPPPPSERRRPSWQSDDEEAPPERGVIVIDL